MKKLLISLLCVIAMTGLMVFPAMANDGTSTMYTTCTAQMYAQPSTASRLIQNIPSGAEIICYKDRDATGAWQHCFYDTSEGWIALSQLSKVRNGNNGGGQNNNLNGTYEKTMYVKETVNFRSAPTLNARIITQVRANDPVYVYQITDGWAECDYGNTHGFIDADFLIFNSPAPAPTPTPAPVQDDVSWARKYDWSTVYNFNDYMSLNPDVRAAYGNNQDAAFRHFIIYGMNEGRQAKGNWNILSYALSHPDLVDRFGSNYRAYYEHACGIPIQ